MSSRGSSNMHKRGSHEGGRGHGDGLYGSSPSGWGGGYHSSYGMLHGPQDGKHRKPLNSKRQQRPSPAYNSPSTADYLAHLNAVAAKKADTRPSPVWLHANDPNYEPTGDREAFPSSARCGSEVDEMFAQSQRAFAAQFSTDMSGNAPSNAARMPSFESFERPTSSTGGRQRSQPLRDDSPLFSHKMPLNDGTDDDDEDDDDDDDDSADDIESSTARRSYAKKSAGEASGAGDVSAEMSAFFPQGTKKMRRAGAGKKAGGGAKGGGRWTKEEDQKLRAAVAAVGPQNWKLIANDFLSDQRSDVQCLHRWQKVLQPGLVKGPWTKEEDQIIVDCIESGITKWSEIAERIPGRIGKQCRERWFNHLDPSLKKGGWTDEEDAILVEAQAKWGNSWTKIAKLLPGRSENAVKNRWNSATRRRAKAATRAAAAAAAGQPVPDHKRHECSHKGLDLNKHLGPLPYSGPPPMPMDDLKPPPPIHQPRYQLQGHRQDGPVRAERVFNLTAPPPFLQDTSGADSNTVQMPPITSHPPPPRQVARRQAALRNVNCLPDGPATEQLKQEQPPSLFSHNEQQLPMHPPSQLVQQASRQLHQQHQHQLPLLPQPQQQPQQKPHEPQHRPEQPQQQSQQPQPQQPLAQQQQQQPQQGLHGEGGHPDGENNLFSAAASMILQRAAMAAGWAPAAAGPLNLKLNLPMPAGAFALDTNGNINNVAQPPGVPNAANGGGRDAPQRAPANDAKEEKDQQAAPECSQGRAGSVSVARGSDVGVDGGASSGGGGACSVPDDHDREQGRSTRQQQQEVPQCPPITIRRFTRRPTAAAAAAAVAAAAAAANMLEVINKEGGTAEEEGETPPQGFAEGVPLQWGFHGGEQNGLSSPTDFLKMDTPVPGDYDLLGVGPSGPGGMMGPITMSPTGMGMTMGMGLGHMHKSEHGEDDSGLGEEFTLSTSLMNISLDKDIVDQLGLPMPHSEKRALSGMDGEGWTKPSSERCLPLTSSAVQMMMRRGFTPRASQLQLTPRSAHFHQQQSFRERKPANLSIDCEERGNVPFNGDCAPGSLMPAFGPASVTNPADDFFLSSPHFCMRGSGLPSASPASQYQQRDDGPSFT